jgi:NAD(P)-dependent dehydrogenase (short-subunit alcohol dehydrogenase family)
VLAEMLIAPHPDSAVIVLTRTDGDIAGTRHTIGWRPKTAVGRKATGEEPLLGAGDVVVHTGGARGIGARVARRLAQRYGCALALIGRSPEPADEPSPELDGDPDERELRRRLIEGGLAEPREIERQVAALLAEAEIASTLQSLRSADVEVMYVAADVSSQEEMAAALAAVRQRLGEPTFVVHGAGQLRDHLISDKTVEEFDAVWSTKVGGAETLRALLPGIPTVYFASISGAVGNVGQADYAAANSALDQLAHGQSRSIAVDWGPWAGGGMVSPELEREYERRGVGLLDPEEAIEILCDQVDRGLPDRRLLVVRSELSTIGAIEARSVIDVGSLGPTVAAQLIAVAADDRELQVR